MEETRTSLTQAQWIITDIDQAHYTHIKNTEDLPPPLIEILLKRGFAGGEIKRFLAPQFKVDMPSPFALQDMDKAVLTLENALEAQNKIAVFGDYDVDGATSTALILLFFRKMGLQEPLFYIPNREKEGYGPNNEAFKRLYDQGARVIITVDCGTMSHDVIAYGNQIGLKTIVIDHHVAEDDLPKAAAIVNPNRLDDTSHLGNLAAVGVTFMFLAALRKRLREKGFFENGGYQEPNLLQLCDLVALGTVCDVMPLIGLNRLFVKTGLQQMTLTQNVGIRSLIEASNAQGELTPSTLGFQLGPRINAAGRIADASLGTQLLTTAQQSEAQALANELTRINQERQYIETSLRDEALLQVKSSDDSALFVEGINWPTGILGLIAGKIKEKYYKPTFAISFDVNGIGKGSARSVEGVDLGGLIIEAKNKGLLVAGGGHKMAGGVTVEKAHYQAFKDFIHEKTKDIEITRKYKVDLSLSILGMNLAFLKSLAPLEPYGVGNPQPLIMLKNLSIARYFWMKEKHLKIIFEDVGGNGLTSLLFNAVDHPLGNLIPALDPGKRFDIVGYGDINEWQGAQRIQFMLKDIADAT